MPAVVIGSGFGGSVAALRLGEAGIDTLVLERGRLWPIRLDGNTFATFEQPDGRAYWLRDRTGEAILGLPQLEKPIDRYVGVLEVVVGNGKVVGAGAGVGGGSLVFNAIVVQPRRELFERVFPRELDFGELEDVHVYWANYGTDTIGRADLDGRNANQSFVTGATLTTGVAVDAGHVYWTKSGFTIGRADLDGQNANQSFTGANAPFGVAVDAGHVYWASSATNAGPSSIGRADLDGQASNRFFITGVSDATGVAVGAG